MTEGSPPDGTRERTRLERELLLASEAGNWSLVAELAAKLKQRDARDRPQAG